MATSEHSTGGAATEKRPAAATATQHLTDRVVTLESIARLPTSTRRLAVCRTAVVTPAVRDEVKKRNIEMVRVDSVTNDKASQPRSNPKQLLIAKYQTPVSPRDLIHSAQAVGIRTREITEATSPEVLAARLTTSIGCQQVAMVLTGLPHVITCAANRNGSLRAAFVQSTHCVTAAKHTLDANVLVVDPTRWSTSDLVCAAKTASGVR